MLFSIKGTRKLASCQAIRQYLFLSCRKSTPISPNCSATTVHQIKPMLDGYLIFDGGKETCMLTSASIHPRVSLLRSRRVASFLRLTALCFLLLLAGYELFENLFAV